MTELGLQKGSVADVSKTDSDLFARAAAIHSRILTMDTHVDIPPDFGTESYDPREAKERRGQIDLMGMEHGGLDAVFFIVYVGQGERNVAGYARAIADAFTKFATIRHMTDVQYPGIITLARTAEEVRSIHREGRLAALIGIENGHALGCNPDILQTYHDYGARYIGLLHNGHNDLGDSAVPYPRLKDSTTEHGGLTKLGHAVVQRANELGVMVDISHAAMTTALDAIRVSRAPVIASHSSIQGVYDHPRNLSDEVLAAIRANGGVAQMVAFDSYLRPVSRERQSALRALRTEMGIGSFAELQRITGEKRDAYHARREEIDLKWPAASVRDFADHIDYAVKFAGIDHVGIASDFNGGGGIAGWNNARDTLNVTVELVRRNYSETQIAQLWGGNLLRVMAAVETAARHSE